MGYTFEIRAGNANQIAQEIMNPTLSVDQLSEEALQIAGDNTLEEWSNLQQFVRQQTTVEGDVTVGPLVGEYMAVVARHGSHFWGTLHHTSSGGADFMDEMNSQVAPYLGYEFVQGLMLRPVAGVASDDYPTLGYATHEEASLAVVAAEPLLPPTVEQSESLRVLHRCVKAASQRRIGLITLYV